MPDASDPRLAVICQACGYPSSAYVAGKIIGGDDDEDGPSELSLIRCEHCDSPSLIRQDDASEAAPVGVWPTSQRTLHEGIPHGVREGVIEARNASRLARSWRRPSWCAGPSRAFCVDQGANHKTLHRSLRELVQRNVIDERLLEWADGLRVLGNVGAHFTGHAAVSKQDASDALDLVEAMLDYVYVFTAKFEQFKACRDAAARS